MLDIVFWMRTGSNPPDINRFWMNTRKILLLLQNLHSLGLGVASHKGSEHFPHLIKNKIKMKTNILGLF